MSWTSFLPNDILSLASNPASKPSPVPNVGEPAPTVPGVDFRSASSSPDLAAAASDDDTNNGSFSTIVAFTRHCGCPFAEKELRTLGAVSHVYPRVKIVVVSHSPQDVAEDWFARIGRSHFTTNATVTVIGDDKLGLFNAYGIGQLSFSGIFSWSSVKPAYELSNQGIRNTQTGNGSNRWLNSGGFIIDSGGVVRWARMAKVAADWMNYERAVKDVLQPIPSVE